MTTQNLQIRQSYAYAVARIRQVETRLLDRSRVARMLEAPAAGDVLKILGETEYSEAIGDLPPESYEHMLALELDRVYSYVSEFVPDPLIVDLFRLRHDLHNCKVAFRAHHLGTAGEAWSSLGTVPASAIRQAVSGDADLSGFLACRFSAESRVRQHGDSGDSPQPTDSQEAVEICPIDRRYWIWRWIRRISLSPEDRCVVPKRLRH